jgi:hypothetical protein
MGDGWWRPPMSLAGQKSNWPRKAGCAGSLVPNKKREWKFNETELRHGVLRTPTHRTKTKTSDGWGTVSSPVGRRSRWGTRKKLSCNWAVHCSIQVRRIEQRQQVSPLFVGVASQQVSGRNGGEVSSPAGRRSQWTTNKKQEWKFNETERRHGVLRTPTHRTKTKTSDGWGTVSSPGGRRSRWTTGKKQGVDWTWI